MLVHNIDPRILHKEQRKNLVSSSRHLTMDKLKVSGNMLSMLHEMTRWLISFLPEDSNCRLDITNSKQRTIEWGPTQLQYMKQPLSLSLSLSFYRRFVQTL